MKNMRLFMAMAFLMPMAVAAMEAPSNDNALTPSPDLTERRPGAVKSYKDYRQQRMQKQGQWPYFNFEKDVPHNVRQIYENMQAHITSQRRPVKVVEVCHESGASE